MPWNLLYCLWLPIWLYALPLRAECEEDGYDARPVTALLGQAPERRSVTALIAALGDGNPEVRRRAAETLGERRDPQAVPALLAALRDDNSEVRWAAAVALGEAGRPDELAEAARSGEIWVRWGAVKALGQIDAPAAVAPLVEALGDSAPEVRREAVEALGRRHDPRIVAALADADPAVRWEAALALGYPGNVQAVEPLFAALADSEVGFRVKLTEALVAIGPEAVEPLIALPGNSDPMAETYAADILARLGSPALEKLIVALKADDPALRRRVTRVLAEIGRPAVAPLSAKLGEEDWRIRAGAALALQKIGDSGAADALRTRIRAVAEVAEIYPDWIGKAESGSLDLLIDALSVLGSPAMAGDFLASGHPELEAAGRRWLEDHGRTLPSAGSKPGRGPRWGEARAVLATNPEAP